MTTERLGTANLNRLFRRIFGLPIAAPKFVLILYYLLPFAAFGQTVVTPYHSLVGSAPFGLVYTLENNVFVSGASIFLRPGIMFMTAINTITGFRCPADSRFTASQFLLKG
jgi:hypothetical protein